MDDQLLPWLRTQIAETRELAHEHHLGCCRHFRDGDVLGLEACDCYGPPRVLAQCEAHTAILDATEDAQSNGEWGYPDRILKALALAYQHCDGYREEWKP